MLTAHRTPLQPPAITPDLMAVNSPWGAIQTRDMIAPGVVFCSTASHGGALVTPEAQAKIPPALRSDDRWYEEDCEIAAIVVTFPLYFTPETVARSQEAAARGVGFNFRGGR